MSYAGKSIRYDDVFRRCAAFWCGDIVPLKAGHRLFSLIKKMVLSFELNFSRSFALDSARW